MRALLIEGNAATAAAVELMLAHEGFSAYLTDSGEEGVDLARLYDYDIVLIADALADVSGFAALRSMREKGVRTPVLMLSGLAGIGDITRAFALGADDYLVKPFHRDELVARMRAIVRRTRGFARPRLQFGDLALDLDEKSVAIAGTPARLTGKEYDLIELLALRAGAVVTKQMMLDHLYGGMDEPELKIIDVFVCKLRKKLAAVSPFLDFIETIWGRGYRLREVPARRSAEAAFEAA